MSKETLMALTVSNQLNSTITAAIVEAAKSGMDKDGILAVLNRIVETIENGD
jgi:hypothetical protein